jgi:dual specificity MAP kinase phosphatase
LKYPHISLLHHLPELVMSIAEYSLNNPPPASPVTSTTLPTGISTINATLGCGSSGPISPDTGPLGSLHKSDSTTQAQFDKPSVVPRSFISPSPLSASSLVTASTTSANDDYSFNLSRALSSVDLNCNSSACSLLYGKLAGAAAASTTATSDVSASHYKHSEHLVSSILRKSSLTVDLGSVSPTSSSCCLVDIDTPTTVQSPFNDSSLTWLSCFNNSLTSSPDHDDIKLISSPKDLSQLLNFYYESRHEFHSKAKYSSTACKVKRSMCMFPYLHGLNSLNQRDFFLEEEKNVTSQLLVPNMDDCDFYNLMFVNSFPDSSPNLINTVDVDNLLTKKVTTPSVSNEKTGCVQEYVPFEEVSRVDCGVQADLNNRNYKDQIRLMAALSSFVVYNYSKHDNLELASLLESLKHTKNQIVYVIDSNFDWSLIGSQYFEAASETNIGICTNDILKAVGVNNTLALDTLIDHPDLAESMLLNYEQNLIWRLNSMKWIMNNKICLGNIIDFNNLSSSNSPEFKLIINCHENATFPSLDLLNSIFDDLRDTNPSKANNVYYIEFPSSGSLNPTNINTTEILAFLNVLKLIYLFVEKFDYNIFIFSFDGFTGLSLLTICVTQMLCCDTVEESIIHLLSNDITSIKLYYFKTDLSFLKQFERFVNFLKYQNLTDFGFITSINFHEINEFHHQRPPLRVKYDWFHSANDNNFPSKVFSDLYLGSLNHANSTTILNATKITHLISIGECPLWINQFRSAFVFDCEDPSIINKARESNIKVLQPIYQFNNGDSCIYEIDLTYFGKYATNPRAVPKYLESLIFIYNLKDDGRDSLLSLLLDCPESVQSKILLANPLPPPRVQNCIPKTTLIHCRIGVSRSASVIIASMMKKYKLNLLTCYLYLRVQRFNIIIQPNLRIFYELFLLEEMLGLKGGTGYNWEVLCNEIFKLNNYYI